MKKYWAFYSDIYYPSGGMNDFIGDFETEKQAKEKIIETLRENAPGNTDKSRWLFGQAHIFDIDKKEIVWKK